MTEKRKVGRPQKDITKVAYTFPTHIVEYITEVKKKTLIDKSSYIAMLIQQDMNKEKPLYKIISEQYEAQTNN
jgi:hypothetical protein